MKKFQYFIIVFSVLLLFSNGYCGQKMTEEKQTSTVDYRHKPDEYWQKVLAPEVYHICRKKGTEPAFSGKYDKFYEAGTYYCACCGGDFPLYSSKAKFDSKTGWPSFFEPIKPENVDLVEETSLVSRFLGAVTEVRCKRCGSHLGHVFDDGPKPTGKRYCMNSLALTFVADKQTAKRTFAADSAMETAIFAGGCFWCEAEVFEHLPGVISVVSGFIGGKTKDPTYKQVSAGGTGHLESVKVVFDPKKISYEKLLNAYWNNIDPFDDKGQFCDKGDSYKAAIFYTSEEQKEEAEASQKAFQTHFKQQIVTEIKSADEFYPAEEYHQHYAQKNPIRYKGYRWGCGRDKRLQQIQDEKDNQVEQEAKK